MVGLEIIKIPRRDPTPDHPINFPSFENLHLELLENKKKLKKGLPLIPVVPKKVKPKPLPPPQDPSPASLQKDSRPEPKVSRTQSEKVDKKEVKHDDAEMLKEFVDTESPDGLEGPSEPSDPIEVNFGEEEHDQVTQDFPDDSNEPEDEPNEIETFRNSLPPDELEIFDEMSPVEQTRYLQMDTEHRERYQKETYLWKWRLLKRSYPSRKEMPEFNEHSDLHTMKISFDRTKRDLILEDTVESYRMYLVVAWLGIEYVCTRQIGIDMSGFTSSQTRMMHKYEKLLIELGERRYSKWGSNLPVEIRLGCLILFQAGVFYLSKVMMSQGNPLFAEIFNGLTGQPPAQKSQSAEAPKKKMRGPTISADDIRNMRSDKD